LVRTISDPCRIFIVIGGRSRSADRAQIIPIWACQRPSFWLWCTSRDCNGRDRNRPRGRCPPWPDVNRNTLVRHGQLKIEMFTFTLFVIRARVRESWPPAAARPPSLRRGFLSRRGVCHHSLRPECLPSRVSLPGQAHTRRDGNNWTPKTQRPAGEWVSFFEGCGSCREELLCFLRFADVPFAVSLPQ